MVLAQWGLVDQLAADPAVWLCHQCNDCSVRCPRDARPGDVLQAVRSLVIERLAAPAALGRLVANARVTWPILFGAPLLLWTLLLGLTGHLAVPAGFSAFGQLVPHWLIYSVFFPVAALVMLAAWVSGRRFWTVLGASGPPRRGSFLGNLAPALGEIATHRRFSKCEAARPRQWGHLALLWGFVGAAVTSGLLVVALYGYHVDLPLPLAHPFKILGNVSAVLLVAGGTVLFVNRVSSPDRTGRSTAFDNFFLAVVLLVIATGVLSELGRFLLPAGVACTVYVAHLSVVLTLFVTFPYSKFAHLMYRTIAMVHECATGG